MPSVVRDQVRTYLEEALIDCEKRVAGVCRRPCFGDQGCLAPSAPLFLSSTSLSVSQGCDESFSHRCGGNCLDPRRRCAADREAEENPRHLPALVGHPVHRDADGWDHL